MNYKLFIAQATEQLVTFNIAKVDEIIGCTPSELREVELAQNIELPQIYKEFLLKMGKGAGRFYRGSSFFYPDILSLKSSAKELLQENNVSFDIPENAFVFFMHQGYQFSYFHIDTKTDNPSVYHYIEGADYQHPIQIWEHFSDFLTASIDDYIKMNVNNSTCNS